MAVVATGTKILYVPLYYFLHTTRLPFVGAKPKQSLTCFLADSVHHGSRQRLQTLSLWRGDDPASTQSSSTHHGRLRMRLVWSKSVGGTNSCYRYNHRVNGGFFYACIISKLLGLWHGNDLSECTVVVLTPWEPLPTLVFFGIDGEGE
jgi:hypothetical protein